MIKFISLPCAIAAMAMLVADSWAQKPVRPHMGPTLQEAIYAAQSGDVLYADRYEPPLKQWINIDRPLTIVGGVYAGTMTLQGPGNGTVSLVDAAMWEAWMIPNYTGWAVPAISGGGFEEVQIVSSFVVGTSPRFWDDMGRPAVTLSVPRLVVVDSSIWLNPTSGSNFVNYTCSSVMGPGPAAVDVWGTVIAIGSTFQGGAGIRYCFDDFSGMCGDSPYWTDAGGAGVVAHEVQTSNCTFVGGAGCSWKNRGEVGPVGLPYILR